MATDFSKPVVTDAYATLLPGVVTALQDLARGLDPVLTGTSTNIPVGTKRFNEATFLWERYNGTSWVAMAASYAISISGSAASCTGNAATASTANALAAVRIDLVTKAREAWAFHFGGDLRGVFVVHERKMTELKKTVNTKTTIMLTVMFSTV